MFTKMRFLYAIILRVKSLGINTLVLFSLIITHSNCKKLVEVDAPKTNINSENVFTNDASAIAFVTGIFSTLSNTLVNTQVASPPSVSIFLGLSADELKLYNGVSSAAVASFYRNDLNAIQANSISFWNSIYPIIFLCNDALTGISKSESLNPYVKNQLLGEASFCRAFCYFYLVNLYGDVPLVITTDWKINASLSRSPKEQVWKQIIDDLNDAKRLLSDEYLDATVMKSTNQRLRPTKWTASALLARSYLFIQDWNNAKSEASLVIDNASLFALEQLDQVFLKNSREAIWQWPRTLPGGGTNTPDAQAFILANTGPDQDFPLYINSNLINAFELGDERRSNWIDSIIVAGSSEIFYYPSKYKDNNPDPTAQPTEYTMIFRLAEMYLIRAEAEIHENNLQAISDLNKVRHRAGLPDYLNSTDKGSLLNAIYHERQVELFTEWGNRWLDLKRTGMIDSVMSKVTPNKFSGMIWNGYQYLYPIPLAELQKTPQIIQNTGY